MGCCLTQCIVHHLLDHYFMMDNPWILFFLDLSFHNDKSLKDDDPVMWILMDYPFIDDAKTDPAWP